MVRCLKAYPRGGSRLRETKYASGYGGERDGPRSEFVGNLETAPITGRKKLTLATFAPVPDRSDSVDDETGRNAKTWSRLGIAGVTTTKDRTRGQKIRRAGCAMDGPVHPATAPERVVRSVDDGIHLEGGDVGE
jgi:hypothetical protein